MEDLITSTSVHLRGDVRTSVSVNDDKMRGWLEVGQYHSNVTFHCSAEQARQLAEGFKKLYHVILDAQRAELEADMANGDGIDPFAMPHQQSPS